MAVGKLIVLNPDIANDGLSEELRDLIGNDEETPELSTSDFFFRSTDVRSMWEQTNAEGERFMIVGIEGMEYPLMYEEYLWTNIKTLLTEA